MPKMKLFVIPHAGGSAMGYMALKRFVDDSFIELVPLEPAGRGKRMKEPCHKEVRRSARDLFQRLKKQIGEGEYAIFGHSLGALIGYELAKIIWEHKMKQPRCLFVSGRCAPGYEFPYPNFIGLSDEEFLTQFSSYQALPQELLENEQIMKLMLPIIRADVDMAARYEYEEYKEFGTDIVAFYGADDCMTEEAGMNAWRGLTKGSFYTFSFPGGHFYYSDNKREVGETITKRMAQYT